jgi:hypothetical protein
MLHQASCKLRLRTWPCTMCMHGRPAFRASIAYHVLVGNTTHVLVDIPQMLPTRCAECCIDWARHRRPSRWSRREPWASTASRYCNVVIQPFFRAQRARSIARSRNRHAEPRFTGTSDVSCPPNEVPAVPRAPTWMKQDCTSARRRSDLKLDFDSHFLIRPSRTFRTAAARAALVAR